MSNKSRTTKVIAHCAKKTLTNMFPDYETESKFILKDENGKFLDEIDKPGSQSRLMIETLAEILGYSTEVVETQKQDTGWISLNDTIYSVTEVSERRCSIRFQTTNVDETEHYEKVDEIVKQLAQKDVAVLRGECEITITTRC